MVEGTTEHLNYLRGLAYKLTKYINYKNIVEVQSTDDPFDEETCLNPAYFESLLKEIVKLRGAVASMVATCTPIPTKDLFMFFVNQLHQHFTILDKFFQTSGGTRLDEPLLRLLLGKIQLTYLKIFAIYETYTTSHYLSIQFIENYLQHRQEVLEKLQQEIEEFKIEENTGDNSNYQQVFQSEIVNYMCLLHLHLVEIVFSYYALFQHSDLDPSIQHYITHTCGRILLAVSKIQENADGSSSTLTLKPDELLPLLYQLFNDLEEFLNFTQPYTLQVEYKRHLQSLPPHIISLFQEAPRFAQAGDLLELFTNRTCPACQNFFKSPLWDFLQHLAHRVGVPLRVRDTYSAENEALCTGIYEIERIPTLKFQDRLYWINFAEESGKNPYNTVIREILNFLGVLGQYLYEIEETSEPEALTNKTPMQDRHLNKEMRPATASKGKITPLNDPSSPIRLHKKASPPKDWIAMPEG